MFLKLFSIGFADQGIGMGEEWGTLSALSCDNEIRHFKRCNDWHMHRYRNRRTEVPKGWAAEIDEEIVRACLFLLWIYCPLQIVLFLDSVRLFWDNFWWQDFRVGIIQRKSGGFDCMFVSKHITKNYGFLAYYAHLFVIQAKVEDLKWTHNQNIALGV